MLLELRQVTNDEEWTEYHAIRRRVLFELRDDAGYDENHPDEHRAGHYPLLLSDASTAVGAIRIDIDGERAIFRRVAIREDLQRRGYGRRLLQAAEEFARQRHCTRVESHVDPDAVGFYERCGFAFANSRGAGRAPLMFKSLV
jgi:GNAT superfamily N-acetyltransferase